MKTSKTTTSNKSIPPLPLPFPLLSPDGQLDPTLLTAVLGVESGSEHTPRAQALGGGVVFDGGYLREDVSKCSSASSPQLRLQRGHILYADMQSDSHTLTPTIHAHMFPCIHIFIHIFPQLLTHVHVHVHVHVP